MLHAHVQLDFDRLRANCCRSPRSFGLRASICYRDFVNEFVTVYTNTTRSRGGRASHRKFGLGFLHVFLPMALTTSFVSSSTHPGALRATLIPRPVASLLCRWQLSRTGWTQPTSASSGHAVHVATELRCTVSSTLVTPMDADGLQSSRTSTRAKGAVFETVRRPADTLSDDSVRGKNRLRQGGVHEPRVPASAAPGAGEGIRDTPRLHDTPHETPDAGGAASSSDPDGSRMGRPPQTHKEISTQANEGPSWSQWELRKALKGLRSDSEVVICQTLRQIHSRLWRAPAKRLKDLLAAAGAPEHGIAEVQNVVDTCSTCREWQRLSNKPMTSLIITSQFNEGVQFDLLFLEDGMIVAHMICLCIRWAQGDLVKDRESKTVLAAIDHFWIRVYGPPKVITSDQEGALFSDEGAIWASRWSIELKSKPKGAHAHVIERRKDLLRQQYNKVRTAARKDGLVSVTSAQVLDESFLACNCLLSVHGTSPYEALFGRVPPLLRDLHGGNAATALDDLSGGLVSKTIISGHANERLRIASNTNTRPAAQTLNLIFGYQIEFYRDPQSKDVTEWRGPGTVVSLDRADAGIIELRWQSRLYQCRVPDVRRVIAYLGEFLQTRLPR